MKKSILLASAAAMVASFATSATAQQVDEIVVTAQKRSENLQEVPISVAAITNDLAASAGVRTSEDLRVVVPALDVQRQTGAADIYIRGIGTAGGQAGQENAVAVFIDGVYQPSMNGVLFALNNIERVEVLKGPQGTLYGRNATGGAVNIILRDPQQDPTMSAEIGYGNLDTVDVNAYISGGLAENVAADLSLYYHDQGKGFGRNVVTGSDVNKARDVSVRSKLLFTPGDDTRITLGGSYVKTKGSFGIGIRPGPDSTPLNGQIGFPYGHWDVQSDVDPHTYAKQWNAYGRIEHDFGPAVLTSITAYGDVKHHEHGDLDLIELPIIEFPLYSRSQTFTQELQLASGAGSPIQWIVGAFYLNNKAQYNPWRLFGLGIEGFTGVPGAYEFQYDPDIQRTKSYAIYGQTTFEVFTDTNLTVGGRYTIDKRKLYAEVAVRTPAGLIPLATVDDSKTFKKPSWRIALDHKFGDDIMSYVSYSRGFKSGVYNTSAPMDPPVEPETLDAYEIGLKTTLFDRRLRFNVAAFRYDYKNIQLQQVRGAATALLNAAKARVYGIDADFNLAVTERLSFNGGAVWLDHKYRDFPNAPITTPVPGMGNVSIDCVANPVGCDASGNKMVRAPDFVFSIAGDYVMPLANGSELALNVSYAYNDGFYWEPGNRLRQGSYNVVNSQLKWTAPNENFNVRVWGRNLFNEKYFTHEAEQALGDLAAAAPGRTYGVSFGVNF